MSFTFQFNGGVYQHGNGSTKFLLFSVIDGKEVPLHVVKREGLILPQSYDDMTQFTTLLPIMKLFVGQSGFGIAKRFHSFYMQFQEPPAPTIKVVPFDWDSFRDYHFEGMVRFLKKKEVLELLHEDNTSRIFVKRQDPLPVDTIRKMITVDRTEMKKGIRQIRIGRQKDPVDQFID